MDWVKRTARPDEKHSSLGIWCHLYYIFYGNMIPARNDDCTVLLNSFVPERSVALTWYCLPRPLISSKSASHNKSYKLMPTNGIWMAINLIIYNWGIGVFLTDSSRGKAYGIMMPLLVLKTGRTKSKTWPRLFLLLAWPSYWLHSHWICKMNSLYLS